MLRNLSFKRIGTFLLVVILMLGAIYLVGLLNISLSSQEAIAIDKLIEKLNDPDPHIKAATIQALGKIGKKDAASAVIGVLSSKSDSLVRSAAIEALKRMDAKVDYIGNLGSAKQRQRGKSWLSDFLLNLRNDFVVDENGFLEFLFRSLVTLVPYVVFILIFVAIDRKLDISSSIAHVFATEEDERKKVTRKIRYSYSGVIFMFLLFYISSYYSDLVSPSVQPTEPSRYQIRLAMIELAGELQDQSSIPMLIQALNNEFDFDLDQASKTDLRWRAAYSLGRIGDKSALSALLRHANDAEKQISQYTSWAIGNILAKSEFKELKAKPIIVQFCPRCGEKVNQDDIHCRNCSFELPRVFVENEEN